MVKDEQTFFEESSRCLEQWLEPRIGGGAVVGVSARGGQ